MIRDTIFKIEARLQDSRTLSEEARAELLALLRIWLFGRKKAMGKP